VEKGIYGKIALGILAILALCIVAGAIIPGSPIKPILEQAAAGLSLGMERVPDTTAPINTRPGNFTISLRSSDYLTVLEAIELTGSDDMTSSWLSSHIGWKLSQARTDHMDSQGNASEWTLTYVDGRDVMMANILNGKVISSNTYTSGASVMLGIRPDGLVDSPEIMATLVGNCQGLTVNEGGMPFSMSLHPGTDPTYLVEYNGMRQSFSAVFDARIGELIESTYRSVST
jgi:hypothetical protein